MPVPVAHRLYLADSRTMPELADRTIDLAVTSPPYWQIKDYRSSGQIGFGQSLHDYLKDLYRVWSECFRVLKPGRRLCLNIGDQFARAQVYGRYKVIPLHAEFIAQAERIGFDFLGSIIWQKKTTIETSGGAAIMGSYPHPPNGVVELDYEYILLFKKPGKPVPIDREIKAASAMTKEEWKQFFSGHWNFAGARKKGHQAPFPEELPRRLIRMFSFVGETVLDPFLGSGTTAAVAAELGRGSVGYELDHELEPLIHDRLGLLGQLEIIRPQRKPEPDEPAPQPDYVPAIQDARPINLEAKSLADREELIRVTDAAGPDALTLADGRTVRLLGAAVTKPDQALEYLTKRIKGKLVFLRHDPAHPAGDDPTQPQAAYVYLKNRIFINHHLIKAGLAEVDRSIDFAKKRRWLKAAE